MRRILRSTAAPRPMPAGTARRPTRAPDPPTATGAPAAVRPTMGVCASPPPTSARASSTARCRWTAPTWTTAVLKVFAAAATDIPSSSEEAPTSAPTRPVIFSSRLAQCHARMSAQRHGRAVLSLPFGLDAGRCQAASGGRVWLTGASVFCLRAMRRRQSAMSTGRRRIPPGTSSTASQRATRR